MSFVQSQAFCGSILYIDPVKWFRLRTQDEAPGVMGNYQIQVQLNVTNISAVAQTPTVFIVYASDTFMTTDASFVSNLIQGAITSSDVQRAYSLPAQPAPFPNRDMFGAGKFSDLLSRANQWLKKTQVVSKHLIPAASMAFPGLQALQGPVSQLGYGRTSRAQMKAAARSVRY